MTVVRIAHAEPRPGRMPEGVVRISSFLVLLADDAAHRALPLVLRGPAGHSLWQLLDRPADEVLAGVLEETAARLLHAAGVQLTGVDIEPTGEDAAELDADAVEARIGLDTGGETRHLMVSAGYGLALATAAGAPVRIADDIMDRHAVPIQGDDLLAQFRPPLPPGAGGRASRPRQLWRFEPRNLTFTDGLALWELAGNFLAAGQPHWQDYSAQAMDGSAVLASAVPEPSGFAVLVQTIYADDYRGAAVTFRGQLRATDVADHAGLHLAVGPVEAPPGAHLRERGSSSLAAPGSGDWTWHEVTMPVPADAAVIRFGISLTGLGRIELRRAQLNRAELNPAELTPARPEPGH
jgi:hypothetical protein